MLRKASLCFWCCFFSFSMASDGLLIQGWPNALKYVCNSLLGFNFRFNFFRNMQNSVVINSMSFLVEELINGSPMLLLGDSLLWGFRMAEVDLISIKGARPQDLEQYLMNNPLPMDTYRVIAVICGGNCFKQKVKNGVVRPNCSPFRVSNFSFHSYCY